jgi:transposase
MYIDIVPNRNSPPAVLLRESHREGKKVVKRTIANLSHLHPLRVEALRRALKGDFDQFAGEPVSGPIFGILFVLKEICDQLGIIRALGRGRLGRLILFLVVARLAHQRSRLSAVRWAEQHAVREVLSLDSFDEDDLYEALDQAAAWQEKIEARLYHDYLERRGEGPTLFLYDLTSTYLEGERNELGEYGYNRDDKRGKKQIVVGLLTDEEGEPLAIRIFSGNTGDPKTVPEQIEILRRQFEVESVVFVGDGGMVKSSGKEALNERGFRYITALTKPQIRKLLKQDVIQLGLFEQKVCEATADGLRYILRKNEAETRKEIHRMEDKLQVLEEQLQARNEKVAASERCKPEAGLKAARKKIAIFRLDSFVEVRLEERRLVLEIDQAAQEQALCLAGCYVLETDVSDELLDSERVHQAYKNLSHLEQDWRRMKTGHLQIRPVYVRKKSRTEGHVFVCFLALKVLRELERRLKSSSADSLKGWTVNDALTCLGRLCMNLYPLKDGQEIPLTPNPDAQQTDLLAALNVSLPQSIHRCTQKNKA